MNLKFYVYYIGFVVFFIDRINYFLWQVNDHDYS